MQKKLKVVGGFVYPDENGKVTLPPEEVIEFSIKKDEYIEIPLQKRNKEQKTER